MVWADCDDNCATPDELRQLFWDEARAQGISQVDFDKVVFIFAKDRLENWVEFLLTGNTDEAVEGPRVKSNRDVAEAAKKLAALCTAGSTAPMPSSLQWSCRRWRALVDRMR